MDNAALNFLVTLARAQAVIARKFDRSLPGGLGLNDFIILYHLSHSPETRLRRIDLADKVGLTASGVTRMLLPMEKIGLVKREESQHDARVSYVKLAPGGKRLLADAMQDAQELSHELMPLKPKQIEEITEVIQSAARIAGDYR